MSMINDMLRDLDKRQAPELGGSASVRLESIVEAQTKKPLKIILVAIALLLMLLVGWWLGSSPDPSLDVQTHVKTEEPINQPLSNETTMTNHIQTEAQSYQDVQKTTVVQSTQSKQESPKIDEVKKIAVATKEQTKESKLIKQDKILAAPVTTKDDVVAVNKQEAKSNINKNEAKPEIKKETKTSQALNITTTETTLKNEAKEQNQEIQRPSETKNMEPLKRVELVETNSMAVSLSPVALDQQTAEKAVVLFAQNNSAEAYRELYAFIGGSDFNVESRTVLATYLLQDGRIAEVGDVLLNAPLEKSPELRQLKARWYAHQGEHKLAIYTLSADLPEISLHPKYFELLAAYQQRYGSAQEAKVTYAKLVEYDETIADWWAGLGLASDRAKEFEQAIFAYKQALELKGLSPELTNFVRPRLLQLETLK